ncbi:MAG: RNA polymerase sigma factor WhiG [Acidimicrobiia bacterium]|nr:RNA polymerase sigma factor WhiG [Acidimicrobiia bacterium]
MVTLTQDDVKIGELWEEFCRNEDQEIRNKLLLYYAPLVKYVASRVAAGLPQNVQHEDLVSYGWFGLIDAVQRFEPAREIKFETYAMQRIRGAILDELRKSDWVPRSVRQKARSIEKAMAKLEGKLGRSANDEELCEELEVTMAQLHKMLTEISNAGIIALDEVLGPHGRQGEALALVDTLADSSDGPMGQYEKRELKQILATAINNMGDREKWVLMLYYFERFTLADIGKVLSVTESRVCQIHTKAVMQLRIQLSRRLTDG